MRIGYARVSTHEQEPAMQEDALKANGCERVYVEHASGASRDRPQLNAALEFMRAGDVLVVWKLDRLARTVRQLVETVEELKARQIDLLSLHDPIDTTSAAGRLVFHVFASVAEFERSLIRDRTLAGLASARARGRLGGRPKRLSNHDVVAAKALLQQSELSVADIAKRLNVSAATLYRHVPGGRSGVSSPA
jgi:DNA invertase Pin-like site-specific DNA recombinase